jgi:hypothetical protein
MALNKIKVISDPVLNYQGVSIFTIWQYKIIIVLMSIFVIVNILNILTVSCVKAFKIDRDYEDHKEFKTWASKVLTVFD